MTAWSSDDLYVRSYRGAGGAWYRHARARRQGRVQAGGKYRSHGGAYVEPMVSPAARATTLRLVPA